MLSGELDQFPILYSFRRCPYAIRARLALYFAHVHVVLREVVLRDKPAHLLQISPKGTVPVLYLHDGGVIEQSLEIMQWALTQHDPSHLLALSEVDQQISEKLIACNDVAFKKLLDCYKYPERYPQQKQSDYRLAAESLLLLPLEQQLASQRINTSKNNIYLFGEHIKFTDIALMPFIRQFALVDIEWFAQAPYPYLQSWLQCLSESEAFEYVMTKYTQWQENDPSIIF